MTEGSRFKKIAEGGAKVGGAILETAVGATFTGMRWYWKHKERIDPYATVGGLALLGTSAAADELGLGFFESLAVATGAGGVTHAADRMVAAVNEEETERHKQILNSALLYGGTLGAAAGASSVVLAGGLDASEAASYLPDSLVLAGLGYGGWDVLRGIHTASRKTNVWGKERMPTKKEPGMTRRRFVSTTAQGAASIAAVATLGTAGTEMFERFIDGRGFFETEQEPGTYTRFRGERMLKLTPLHQDSYASVARDFSISEHADAISNVSEQAGDGFIYVPEDLLRDEFRNLETEAVTEFLVPGGTLWSLATDYVVPPGTALGDEQRERRDELIRVMQRLSHLPDETNISTTQPVIIPREFIYPGRMEPAELRRRFEAEVEGDTAVLPEPGIGALAIDRSYFNLNATTPRRRTEDGPVLSPDMLIIHTSETPAGALGRDAVAHIMRRKSAHYVIDRDGTLYMTVDPRFHANGVGESLWKGRDWLNTYAINVELIAKVEGERQQPITGAQYARMAQFHPEVRGPFSIPETMVLGHNQVAFSERYRTRGRKGDPGLDFDWHRAGLPNNYNILDPDVLACRVRPNPHMEDAGRVWPGHRKAFEQTQGRCR